MGGTGYFDPSPEYAGEIEHATHLVMAVIGVLIYELGNCAATMSPANIMSASKQLEFRKSYAKHMGDFASALNGIPARRIE